MWREFRKGKSLRMLKAEYTLSIETIRSHLSKRFGADAYRAAAQANKTASGPRTAAATAGKPRPRTHPWRPPVRKPMPPPLPVARGSVAGLMIEAGLSRSEIASAFGYHSGSAAQHLLRSLPEYQDQQKQKQDRWATARELHEAGATTTEIARGIGVVRPAVYGWLTRQGLQPNKALHHPNGAQSRLIEINVALAWRLFCAGMPVERVAKQMGVSGNVIRKRFRKTYGEEEYNRRQNKRGGV